jgi:1-aminocyclopropane-1-carboxylate deaminase/D-cysteine desulfhydrase-like pyridoxal-dependent ACC family enzyme
MSDPLACRWPLAQLPTPLEPMPRLERELGLAPGRLWVKRDDQTGLAMGGNKARKLEFVLHAALLEGADTLVVGGGAQSNAVRATAAAAAKAGLSCVAIVGGPEPAVLQGNLLLDRWLGADIEWLEAYDFARVEAAIAACVERLARAGRRPYRVPIGVSTPLGARGYALCAQELQQQASDASLLVVAAGSGGTQAGLLAGFAQLADQGHRTPAVWGVDVGARPGVAAAIDALAAQCAAEIGAPRPALAHVLGDQIGAGYGAPTAAMAKALQLAARLEGLLLDPVYSGKALAGLIAANAAGQLPASGRIIFLHTGGTPALFDGRFAGLAGDAP